MDMVAGTSNSSLLTDFLNILSKPGGSDSEPSPSILEMESNGNLDTAMATVAWRPSELGVQVVNRHHRSLAYMR